MQHYLISRLAINLSFYVNNDFDNWFIHRINLYNNFTRKSLKNQTNQNFKLITLVSDKFLEISKEFKLNNEEIIVFKNFNEVCSLIKEKAGNKDVIISRLDSDDCLHEQYVDNVQKEFNLNKNYYTYLDVSSIGQLRIEDKKTYINSYYIWKKSPSSFLSSLERGNDILCLVYRQNHEKINKKYNGKIIKNKVLQLIHKYNISNSINNFSKECNLNLKKFGDI